MLSSPFLRPTQGLLRVFLRRWAGWLCATAAANASRSVFRSLSWRRRSWDGRGCGWGLIIFRMSSPPQSLAGGSHWLGCTTGHRILRCFADKTVSLSPSHSPLPTPFPESRFHFSKTTGLVLEWQNAACGFPSPHPPPSRAGLQISVKQPTIQFHVPRSFRPRPLPSPFPRQRTPEVSLT